MTGSDISTGVLILSVWIEGDPDSGFRARLTGTTDVADPPQRIAITASVGDTVAIVQRWLNTFVAQVVAMPRPDEGGSKARP